MEQCAFIDTTLLVESLFKTAARRKSARAKIGSYQKSLLPVYAIKELKGGALRYFIWFHNKLSETGSFNRTIHAIQRNFRQPYLMGTALEALQAGTELLVGKSLSHAETRAKTDLAVADSLRLSTRRLIHSGWRDRRKFVTHVVDPLTCFAETSPTYNETTRLLEDPRRKCDLEPKCCLAPKLRSDPSRLQSLIVAIEGKQRPEDTKRRAALHLLKNTPKRDFDDKNCSALGDAYFALYCPMGCRILTTNAKDHAILAGALNQGVDEYKPPET
jgi:hypothetical protein